MTIQSLAVGIMAYAALVATPIAQQVGAKQEAREQASDAETAANIAKSGFSAGFVIALSPELDAALIKRLQARSGFMRHRSGFGVWMDSVTATALTLDRALQSQDDVRGALERLRMRSTATASVTFAAGNIVNYAAADVTQCRTALQRPLRTSVSGDFLPEVVAALASSATGAAVPRGYVGSCIGTNDTATESVVIEAGTPLHEALNRVVGAFGASVWAAVQTGTGQCSLGSIRRAHGGGVCTAAATEDLGRERTR